MSPRRLIAGLSIASLALLAAGCADSEASGDTVTLEVGAVTSPMTDVVEAAAGAVREGYEITLVEVSDYVTINNMLAAGDIDANFSQHLPYMQEFNAKNDADLEAVTPIYNFEIAFYSKEYDDIDDLPDGAQVAIPNDSSNTARALKLLAREGLLELDGAIDPYDATLDDLPDGAQVAIPNDSSNTARALKLLAREGLLELDGAIDPYDATLDDIVDNPKDLEFLQLEINQLNTAYDESDLVFQWPSHIAALGLTPQDDGLLTETDPRFALQLVVNGDTADGAMVDVLREAFVSDAVRAVIAENETIDAAF